MRKTIHEQTSFVEPLIEHEHAQEFGEIHRSIDAHPQIAELVHRDLVFGLSNPHAGRRGRMTAEQVFKALIIKQMNGFSYAELAFHLEESRTYRIFCGFGWADVRMGSDPPI